MTCEPSEMASTTDLPVQDSVSKLCTSLFYGTSKRSRRIKSDNISIRHPSIAVSVNVQRRLLFTCVHCSQCWTGQRDWSSESESTTTSRTPCVATSTGCRCNSVSSSSCAPSWAKCLCRMAPTYLADTCTTVSSTTGRQHLRSSRLDNPAQSAGAIRTT